MLNQMLDESVSKYTHYKLTVVKGNIKVSEAAREMVDSKIDSILVSEEDDIIGIVTNQDILAEVVAKGRDPNQVTVKEITQKPLITIFKDAPVRDAIALMTKHDIRRLVVYNDERPIGLISRKQIVGNLGEYVTTLPVLESPNKYWCPYCPSVFQDKKVLSIHIDDIHIGRGLLEGNLAKARA